MDALKALESAFMVFKVAFTFFFIPFVALGILEAFDRKFAEGFFSNILFGVITGALLAALLVSLFAGVVLCLMLIFG